jgi:hypothetical protein
MQVERTIVGKRLPLYTDYRHGRTKCYTLIRRVSGDLEVRRQLAGDCCVCDVCVCDCDSCVPVCTM